MPHLYLRLPHYVAAYLRNRDEQHPIPVGGVVELQPYTLPYAYLHSHLTINQTQRVNKMGCFCQLQWGKMLHGLYLTDPLRPAPFPIPATHLTDAQVSTLAGLPSRADDDILEYICIKLPTEFYYRGRTLKTNNKCQLLYDDTKNMVELLKREFWEAFFHYMTQYRRYLHAQNLNMLTMDGVERFMTRFDIQNSNSNREKNALKRNYNRKKHHFRTLSTDIIEFGQ